MFLTNAPKVQLLCNPLWENSNIQLSMLRLDQVHPVVSGNKLFKLKRYLQQALAGKIQTIVTFGGAYSNHLVATAFSCQQSGLKSVGLVRGEKPDALSHTLRQCLQYGMQLQYLPRGEYREMSAQPDAGVWTEKFGEQILVPGGGFGRDGMLGAEEITGLVDMKQFTHVCVPIGTATTFAGLVSHPDGKYSVLGFPALKNMRDIEDRLDMLAVNRNHPFQIISDFHFGGYAKTSSGLFTFMNSFFEMHGIALDFVYTAKMMFGVEKLIQADYFGKGATILVVHTGGLQGNLSLRPGVLNF